MAWFDLVGVFLNINCGSSSDIVDSRSGLWWYADDEYISTGFTFANVPDWSGYPQLGTLRYFNDTRIPKYSIPDASGNPINSHGESRVLLWGVRQFELAAYVQDGHRWVDGWQHYQHQNFAYSFEYTYQAQGNVTFLCLLRDYTNANPFISTISLRRVKPYPTMSQKYLEKSYIVQTNSRYSFGATNTPRYVCNPCQSCCWRFAHFSSIDHTKWYTWIQEWAVWEIGIKADFFFKQACVWHLGSTTTWELETVKIRLEWKWMRLHVSFSILVAMPLSTFVLIFKKKDKRISSNLGSWIQIFFP